MTRILFGLIAVALAAAATASAAVPPAMRVCGTVLAARWQLDSRSGARYTVKASGSTSCSSARRAAQTLTHANVHAAAAVLAGSPRGYTCTPLISRAGRTGVFAGLCVTGDNPLEGGFSRAPVDSRVR